jgi:hypothetical protein
MKPGKQIQTYLPGMKPEKVTEKQPHQMSPEEFIEHPQTLFHSTTASRSPEEWSSPENVSVHVGSYRSTLDRHAHRGTTQPGRILAGWINPKLNINPTILSDDEANFGGPWSAVQGVKKPRTVKPESVNFYRNHAEDPGSLSALLPRATDLITHAQFVKEAIDNGKADEVHPKTMAMYLGGHLSGWWQPYGASKAQHPRTAKESFEAQAQLGDTSRLDAAYRSKNRTWERPSEIPDWGFATQSTFGLTQESQKAQDMDLGGKLQDAWKRRTQTLK